MHHGFLVGDLGEEGRSDGELAFTEEVHGDGAINEVFLFGEGIVLGAGEGPIFEELRAMIVSLQSEERGCIGQASRAM